jgi:hypothetical protein
MLHISLSDFLSFCKTKGYLSRSIEVLSANLMSLPGI